MQHALSALLTLPALLLPHCDSFSLLCNHIIILPFIPNVWLWTLMLKEAAYSDVPSSSSTLFFSKILNKYARMVCRELYEVLGGLTVFFFFFTNPFSFQVQTVINYLYTTVRVDGFPCIKNIHFFIFVCYVCSLFHSSDSCLGFHLYSYYWHTLLIVQEHGSR